MLPFEHLAILTREHLYELRCITVPVIQRAARDLALRVLMMPHDQRVQTMQFVGVGDRPQLDHPEVAPCRERAVLVEHVGDAAAHSGREVAPGLSEYHDEPARHVLTSMIAHA